MSDSKKSSDEASIISKIALSIEKIDKIDLDESEDEINEINEKNENNGNIEGNNEKESKKDFDHELPLTSKADEFLSDDSKRKFPILAIIGSGFGLILIIFGIIFMLSASERVVDSVASGETGTISIFIIFLGILILGMSFLKIFAKTGPISNVFDNFNDLTLLDEDKFDNEESTEKKQSNKENTQSHESFDSIEDFELYDMTKLDELEDLEDYSEEVSEKVSEEDLEEVLEDYSEEVLEEVSEEDLEEVLEEYLEEYSEEILEEVSEEGLKGISKETLNSEEIIKIFEDKLEAASKSNGKDIDSNNSNEDK